MKERKVIVYKFQSLSSDFLTGGTGALRRSGPRWKADTLEANGFGGWRTIDSGVPRLTKEEAESDAQVIRERLSE